MSDLLPMVTVLVPMMNERRDIAGCLERIARQDYPVNRIQVIVVDGGSEDGSPDVARQALATLKVACGEVFDNPGSTTPGNLNAGLRRALGEIVCRVDARTLIEPHYVRTCVELLTTRPDVAVVGGSQVAVAVEDRTLSAGIARALNNRWAMGSSRYRRGAPSGPSDTVYLGAFRTSELRAAGGWDERFVTNQDFELNRRMGRIGLVWFDDRLQSGYVPRSSLRALLRQYRRFGTWKVRYWRATGDRPQARQVVLMALPATGAVAAAVAARRLGWGTAVAAVGAGLALDQLGASAGTAAPNVLRRAVAVAAMGTVATGWTLGVWEEALRGRGRTWR
jgi:glycosyltransferase involved in cell wall biosynthesis